MGSLCSKFSTHQGGHTVLGQGSTVGGEADDPNLDPRAAAAAAAERRADLAKKRDKGGKLAQQLAAQRGKKPPSPEPPDRLVWD